MRRKRLIHISMLAAFLAVTLLSCAGDTGSVKRSSAPKRHEEIEPGKPLCTECHDDDRAVYNHNSAFFDKHGRLAGTFSPLCEGCHKPKFCSDCHGNKEDIVPSRKLGNRPDLESPHRGDYFTKHKIEGRLDKSTCFKCHGRRNNKRCKRCHDK